MHGEDALDLGLDDRNAALKADERVQVAKPDVARLLLHRRRIMDEELLAKFAKAWLDLAMSSLSLPRTTVVLAHS